MIKKTNYFVVFLICVIVILIMNNGRKEYSGIAQTNPNTHYNNEPIHIDIITPVELTSAEAIHASENITFTKTSSSPLNYRFDFGKIQPGILQMNIVAGNYTKIIRNEVKRPFINVNHNIPLEVEKNVNVDFTITTSSPQGKVIDADKVVLQIENPKAEKQTYTLTKSSTGTFKYAFKYTMSGIYYFRMEATEPEYDTITVVTQTNVLNKTSVNFYPMLLFGGTLLLILLMLIKRIKK